MEIEQRIELGLADQGRHHAGIGNADGEPVHRPGGRNHAAVPKPEAELQAELLMRLDEKAAQGREALVVTVHEANPLLSG